MSMEPVWRDAALGLLEYIQASPTPFHAVAASLDRLRAAGFEANRRE